MAWSGFHITKSGRDLLNRCLTTGAFRFVKVVLGDGAYTGSWDDYAPVSPKMTFQGEDMRVYRSGDSTRVEISLTSDGSTAGWYYREYALFATDGSDTVVFACDTCGGDGEYIDPSKPSVLLDDRLCWEFVISADASVNVTYQSSTYVPAQGGESGETVVTFTEAQDASLEDLSSGASLSSLWSIAKKLLADLSDAISQVSPDITAQTKTTITGILKGANGKIAAAIAGTDYFPPTGGTVSGPVKIADATQSTGETTGALVVSGGVGVDGDIYANRVFGAVWNDYAERRIVEEETVLPGQVACETGNDTLALSTRRMQPLGYVITDTYGMEIGRREYKAQPVGVSGRVLVRVEGDRTSYQVGDALCAAPGGVACKMTPQEAAANPQALLGYVCSVPDYESWGNDEYAVQVDGRIWMRIG